MKTSCPSLIPTVWTSPRSHVYHQRVRAEALERSAKHHPPVSAEEWKERAALLKENLLKTLHIEPVAEPLDVEFHRETALDGYRIVAVSFCSSPGIRVTGNLFIPSGPGPFPAVLNVHGHFSEGKIAGRVQARGHTLAQNGFVVLTVDAPGAGERGTGERLWEYHGAAKAVGLILAGDTLLGWQVRDNKRALDVLQSLPFVDPARLGVTGASGGGNQTMWVSALDERVKAVVPVVSVGAFEAYVGRRNCMCETLPGGLGMAEEWGVLGLIAPRPLLILNSMHDQPSFGVPELTATARVTQEIYELFRAREKFDYRFLDMPHGYWPPMLEAMLGWMKFWLKGEGPSSPAQLPNWNTLEPEPLLCFESGKRPDAVYSYAANRQIVISARKPKARPARTPEESRQELATLVGWKKPECPADLRWKEEFQKGIAISPRQLPVPVVACGLNEAAREIKLIVSPEGKQSPFVRAQWDAGLAAGSAVVSFDLPGSGELNWDGEPVRETPFHDTARACLWLGYTLAGEWAEVFVSLHAALQKQAPSAKITVVAEAEAAFAAWIARALEPGFKAPLEEHGMPCSLEEMALRDEGSLVWAIPGLLAWGGLDLLRTLGE